MFENFAMPLNDLVQYLAVGFIIETVALIMIWFLAGDIVYIWLKAWWTKRPISLEWTKSKYWKFQIPNIPKGVPEVWELDNATRVIEVRREAVGIAPHKVPMMLSTSEFPAAVNPTEVHGDRFFVPQDAYYGVLFNGKIHKVNPPSEDEINEYNLLESKELRTAEEDGRFFQLSGVVDAWNRKQLWVKYPEHGLNISEFVNYQKVSTDPKIVAAYARRKEIDAKMAIFSPMSTILQNPIPIVIILFGAAIAFWFLSDHSAALSAQSQLAACKDQLIGYAQGGVKPIAQQPFMNITKSIGGGVV